MSHTRRSTGSSPEGQRPSQRSSGTVTTVESTVHSYHEAGHGAVLSLGWSDHSLWSDHANRSDAPRLGGMQLDYLHHLERESARFESALVNAAADARVPSCPDW